MTNRITRTGDALALKLTPSLGVAGASLAVREICALLARHARTVGRYAEEACNRTLTKTEEKRVADAEARIRELCVKLPLVNGQEIQPKFQGDPRGHTVRLVMPDGRYDGLGGVGDGLAVETS